MGPCPYELTLTLTWTFGCLVRLIFATLQGITVDKLCFTTTESQAKPTNARFCHLLSIYRAMM